MAPTEPVEFFPLHGGRTAFGYRAEILPIACEVILAARDAGALTPNQKVLAAKAEILVRGLAHIGITALVDEATGYQADRARDALERILNQFISEEYRKWIKTFPTDFYREMFRLKGWEFEPENIKRPSLVGTYTNDLVYKRLAPGILDELKKKNPKTQSGYRPHKHHQWLTEDVGHPKLREHLAAVVALMKVSNNWDGFMQAMNKALPKWNETMMLDLEK